jgi:dienelactone hydrolase
MNSKSKRSLVLVTPVLVFVLVLVVPPGMAVEYELPPTAEEVESILEEVDPWIAEDTEKTQGFIEKHNEITLERISSSPHWEPTLEDLGDILGIDYLGAPDIDNTGKIYFKMRITGEESALFYVDGPWQWPVQMTPNGWEDIGLQSGDYKLDPDGQYLYLSVMKYGDENWDIFRFGRNGDYEVLLEDRSLAFGLPFIIDDNSFYFSISSHDLGTVWLAGYDIASGIVDTLYTEPGAYALIDHRDGKLLCIRIRSMSELQLFEVDAETGETRDLTDWGLFHSGDYTKEGRVITLTGALSGEDEFMKLAIFAPSDAVVTPEDMQLLYDPGVEIDGAAFDRELGRAALMLNRDGYSDAMFLDLDGSVEPMPTPGVGIIDEANMNDRGDVVFSFNSPSVVPSAYYIEAGKNVLEPIGKISTFGYDFSTVSVGVIHYPSTDGTMIPALLYVPEGAERDGTNPCIINYHGGPMAQSRPYFQRNIAFALNRGVVFLFPNVRGSTGYGPAWEQGDDLENRFQALGDAEAAFDYMFDEGWTTPERTAIWGASYGGYTVNYLAVKAPEKFACGISEVGVSDVNWTNTHSNQIFRETWEREMAPVGSDLSKVLSPIYFAHAVERPLYITAGSNDPRVPASDPRRFAYVLDRLGKDILFYEETKAGHGASTKSMVTHDLARAYTFAFDHILK